MPTADFVTLLVVQSIFGVDLDTAQTTQFQSTVSAAVGHAIDVPAKQVDVVAAVAGDNDTVEVLLLATKANISPKTLGEELKDPDVQVAIW